MTAEFYLQTVDVVFQRHLLPKGEYMHRGKLVDPAAIKDTALLAIEGERDDISGIGQTKSALTLATKLAAGKKHYHLAKDVGHYGIFNGRKWRENIAPVVEKSSPRTTTLKAYSRAIRSQFDRPTTRGERDRAGRHGHGGRARAPTRRGRTAPAIVRRLVQRFGERSRAWSNGRRDKAPSRANCAPDNTPRRLHIGQAVLDRDGLAIEINRLPVAPTHRGERPRAPARRAGLRSGAGTPWSTIASRS